MEQLPRTQNHGIRLPEGKKPYEGKDPYIFISYSHRDGKILLPIITQLIQDGYRVWFDEGIDPGSEWDTNIAAHIGACEYFIGFLSKNYLASDNCVDELTHARELKKKRLLVYLEDVKLPDGLQMRLSRLQAIHKYTYSDNQYFYSKLYSTDGLKRCRIEQVQAPVLRSQEVQRPVQQVAQTASVQVATVAADEPKEDAKNQKEIWAEQGFEVVNPYGHLRIDKYTGEDAVVVIPEGIEEVWDHVFSFHNKLEELVFSDSVKDILHGSGVPFSCLSLRKITLPGNICFYHNRQERIFRNCVSLETVIISDGTVAIREGLFEGCGALKDVHIPSSVISIGSKAFAECSRLKEIAIPNGVVEIGSKAFSFCSSLKKLVIPQSLRQIEFGAFLDCTALTDVRISNGVTIIEEYAFKGCTALKKLTIPESVNKIGRDAFEGCNELKSIYLPEGLEWNILGLPRSCKIIRNKSIARLLGHKV